MGKSNKLFKAVVSTVKAFKSPSRDKTQQDRLSNKGDKDPRKGGKEKCMWSLGKSSSRSRDSLAAVAAFLDDPEVKSVDVKNGLSSSGSRAPDYEDEMKNLNYIPERSVTGRSTLHCTEGLVQEELAAVRIQAAIRRYLATKCFVRVLRALVKLQALWRGQRVRKQAAAALRCMQALIKVQALARGHRVRSSELGQLIQKHIQQTRQLKKRPAEGWVSSMATVEQLQAKAQSKQDAVMKRQRAMVYAYSEQLNRTSKQISSSSVDYQPDRSHWGWAWLERWMAAQEAGVSHKPAKGRHSKFDKVQNKSDADIEAEEHNIDLVSSMEFGENNYLTVTGGNKDVGVAADDTISGLTAVEDKETVSCVEKTLDQVKRGQEGLNLETLMGDVVKDFLPSPLPPPPPPPPPQLKAKLVSNPLQSPCLNAVGAPSTVYPKVVQRAVSSKPPPPPPPPPGMTRIKPSVVHERSSSKGQQIASLATASCQSTKSPLSILAACANEISKRAKTASDITLPCTTAVSPVLDRPSSLPATSMRSAPLPDEPLSALVVPDDPLLEASSLTLTASSNGSRMGQLRQSPCDGAPFTTGTLSTSPKVMSPLHSSMALLPELSAWSEDQHAIYIAPCIVPDVTDGNISFSAAETKLLGVKGDVKELGIMKVDAVNNVEDGTCGDFKTDISDQDEIDMDVDEPDETNVFQPNSTTQFDTGTKQNDWDDLMKAVVTEKPMEVFTNKHAASSRQGQLTDKTSPSLPNYMTATKSAKAKVRSPTQKVESPKQPRFDTSKAKFESPKQKQDLTKQKAESPSQKTDFGVNRRHSLTNSEGKLSAGANKLATGVLAKSKSQSASTIRGSKSTEEYCHSNNH